MIQRSELGWLAQEYNDFISHVNNPAVSFVLEAYSADVSTVSDIDVGTVSEDYVDAITCNDVVIRAYGSSDLKVGTLASSWTETSFGVAILCPPSLAASGDTCRLFYVGTSGSLYYRESTDKGSSWGSQTQVSDVEVVYAAASSLTTVHIIEETGRGNYRLGVLEYDGSWTKTMSYVYWPFKPTSFDAIEGNCLDDGAALSNDIVAFTTDFPPLIHYRVDGTELVRKLERVQGVALFRFQNGKWSHHYEHDVVDRVETSPARTNLRLSKNDDYILMTYTRVDGQGSHVHTALAVSRSKTGIHWEQPYLLACSSYAAIAVNGDYVYFVDSTGRTSRSPMCGYFGESKLTHDLTGYLLSLDIRSGDIKEMQATLANPEGVLDDILDKEIIWQARAMQGWNIDGTELLAQTILADVEQISRSRGVPGDYRVLGGRDALGRVASMRADYVLERSNWQAGGDNFKSIDDTKYSGLRHTAGYGGHWEAQDETLQLRSGKEPGVGYNTQVSNAWNGSAEATIKVGATDANDFAGLIFRGLDKYNFWHLTYDADRDIITSNLRKDNVDDFVPAEASEGSIGWSSGTWHYLKVRFFYNLIIAYKSDDGVEWEKSFDYELSGISPESTFTWANIPLMRGSMGYVGHGYSEYSVSYPPMPWEPLPIELPEGTAEWPSIVYFATTAGGIYFTNTFTGHEDITQPTWTKIGGLDSEDNAINNLDTDLIHDFGIDPADGLTYQYCLAENDSGQVEAYARTADGTSSDVTSNWVKVLTHDTVVSDMGADAEITSMAVDTTTGHLYITAIHTDLSPTHGMLIYKNTNHGEPGYWSQITQPTGIINDPYIIRFGSMHAHNGTLVAGICFDSPIDTHIMWSVDGGTNWYKSVDFSSTIYYPQVEVSQWSPTTAFVGVKDTDNSNYDLREFLLEDDSGGLHITDVSEKYHVLFSGPKMWFDPNDSEHQRLISGNAGDNKMYWTTDGWDTVNNNSGWTGTGTPHQLCANVNPSAPDYIILGCTNLDGIYAAAIKVTHGDTNEEGEQVTYDKAGNMHGTAPYTNSIPWTCGGPCRNGIQAILGD